MYLNTTPACTVTVYSDVFMSNRRHDHVSPGRSKPPVSYGRCVQGTQLPVLRFMSGQHNVTCVSSEDERRSRRDAFHRCKAGFRPETLLSHLFVFALINALRAATKTPAAFIRLMKVSADGAGAVLLCVCAHGSVSLQTLPD